MVERNKINFEQILRRLKFDLVWSDFQLFIVIFLVTALCWVSRSQSAENPMKNGSILDIKIFTKYMKSLISLPTDKKATQIDVFY